MPHEVLAKYSFLPWLKQGIGTSVSEKDNGSQTSTERATINIRIELNNSATNKVEKAVDVTGPGDIIGINQKSIVRVEPSKTVTEFEPNYLPYIEFYEEDFPWRYTPAMPDNTIESGKRLRPWMMYVALKEDEFTFSQQTGKPLPAITVANSQTLPDPATLWAWAHVHINDSMDGLSIADAKAKINHLIQENPDKLYSRIVCPRRLEPNTTYHTFLVPVFETGRKAGLQDMTGMANVGVLQTAWDTSTASVVLPVYYRSTFHTGSSGDFETLVRRLVPRVLPSSVGSRKMDIREPGEPLNALSITTEFLGLGGALKTVNTIQYTWNHGDAVDFKTPLQDYINKGASILDTYNSNNSDPVISAPLYGRWHALVKNLTTSSPAWIKELNLEPANRVAAGLGGDVVRKNQEDFMDEAWAQVGEVIEANRKMYLAQLAKEANYSLLVRNISSLPEDKVMEVTGAVQKNILVQGATATSKVTVIEKVKNSNLPESAVQTGFRKVKRERGIIGKRLTNSLEQLGVTQKFTQDLLVNINDTSKVEITAATPKVNTSGFLTDSQISALNTTIAGWETSGTAPANSFYKVVSGTDVEGDPLTGNVFKSYSTFYSTLTTVNPVPITIKSVGAQVSIPKQVLEKINPLLTIVARTSRKIGLTSALNSRFKFNRHIPVMAAPTFKQKPMYEFLRDISSDFIIPNVNEIQNNTICLLETNPQFIESYMVGLNYEMGRELLWREYPTDQRGTYFKQFWDARGFVNKDGLTLEQIEEKLAEIKPIDLWSGNSSLGATSHKYASAISHSGQDANSSKVVLLIRGDLFKKYPGAAVYAMKAGARPAGGGPPKPRSFDETVLEFPIFKANIGEDITFFGFNLTTAQVAGNEEGGDYGWYFVIQERLGQPRFGLDEGVAPASLTSWDDMSWGSLEASATALVGGNIDLNGGSNFQLTDTTKEGKWASNAADMAYILYQVPVMVAIHASKMLPQ